MIDCEFELKNNVYICKHCGYSTKLANIHHHCLIMREEPPSLPHRAINFVKATTNHVLAGSPKSSLEEINKRLTICKDCPLFKKYSEEPIHGVCMHESCGCNISDTNRFLNKLAWKDQKCPLDKW